VTEPASEPTPEPDEEESGSGDFGDHPQEQQGDDPASGGS